MDTLAISVVVSTRNRDANVVLAVESVLRNSYPSFEVLVVDQSEGEETAAAMQKFVCDSRVSYTRSAEKGLSNGRNLGVRNTKGALIAVTDDDCEVASDWLQQIASAFAVNPEVGVVFGTALAAAHDAARGLIPSYVVRSSSLTRSLLAKPGGIGACMAFRRDVWEQLGGFDSKLGAGSCFRAGEELDFAARALLSGYHVYQTPDARVIHRGFRPLEALPALADSYWYGTGAALIKLLKCGHLTTLPYLCTLAWAWAFHPSSIASSFGPHTSRWSRLRAFTHGMAEAAVAPVNRKRGHFA